MTRTAGSSGRAGVSTAEVAIQARSVTGRTVDARSDHIVDTSSATTAFMLGQYGPPCAAALGVAREVQYGCPTAMLFVAWVILLSL